MAPDGIADSYTNIDAWQSHSNHENVTRYDTDFHIRGYILQLVAHVKIIPV